MLSSLPSLRTRFVTYGSRATFEDTRKPKATGSVPNMSNAQAQRSWLEAVLDYVTLLQVPHGWFLHFYVVSVVCSLFWGVNIIFKSPLLVTIAEAAGARGSLSMSQIALMWSLMAVQGLRRLAESLLLGKSSASKMWFVHWILGILFYVAMSIAVWIEGAGTSSSRHENMETIN